MLGKVAIPPFRQSMRRILENGLFCLSSRHKEAKKTKLSRDVESSVVSARMCVGVAQVFSLRLSVLNLDFSKISSF